MRRVAAGRQAMHQSQKLISQVSLEVLEVEAALGEVDCGWMVGRQGSDRRETFG